MKALKLVCKVTLWLVVSVAAALVFVSIGQGI